MAAWHLFEPVSKILGPTLSAQHFLESILRIYESADPTAKFEDQIWYIDRVSRENAQLVEFELISKLDLTNLQLPGRQVQDYCPWVYRGVECGYTGGSYFDVNDNATSAANDVCGKRFNSCKIRFQSQGISSYPHGGYPGSRIQI